MAIIFINDILSFCLVFIRFFYKVFLFVFIKKTAGISTGSWLSKQPGQVFDIIPIGIKTVYSV